MRAGRLAREGRSGRQQRRSESGRDAGWEPECMSQRCGVIRLRPRVRARACPVSRYAFGSCCGRGGMVGAVVVAGHPEPVNRHSFRCAMVRQSLARRPPPGPGAVGGDHTLRIAWRPRSGNPAPKRSRAWLPLPLHSISPLAIECSATISRTALTKAADGRPQITRTRLFSTRSL